MEFNHVSVLLNEAVEGLSIDSDGIYVDGTLGGGGHSSKIASKLKNGRLICIDRDEDAITAAKERLKEFDCITYVHENYSNTPRVLKDLGIDHVNGILLDLGVSSFQIDEPKRGFSYMVEDAPLDMRMNKQDGIKASDILNTYEEEELINIFKTYGEEKFSVKIAKAIVRERQKAPIELAGDLNRIIRDVTPNISSGGHPSKRVFQALRIEVNGELEYLTETVNNMIDLLDEEGRLCIITFHSLEDRIVKNCFKNAQDPCTCPKSFPVCVCGNKSKGRIITRKPIIPSDEETKANKRSKSAKLRIFERHHR